MQDENPAPAPEPENPKPGPKRCQHCNKKVRRYESRGLCRSCYENLEVREKYPVKQRYVLPREREALDAAGLKEPPALKRDDGEITPELMLLVRGTIKQDDDTPTKQSLRLWLKRDQKGYDLYLRELRDRRAGPGEAAAGGKGGEAARALIGKLLAEWAK